MRQTALRLKIAADIVQRVQVLPRKSVVGKALTSRAKALLIDTAASLDVVEKEEDVNLQILHHTDCRS